jgi:hypothetical protein
MKKKRIDITIDEKILNRFRKKCIDEDITASRKIENLMTFYLDYQNLKIKAFNKILKGGQK